LHYDYALAVLLLTTPLDPGELGPHLEVVKPTFLRLAVEAEILDRREESYFEGLSRDPVGDVRALRQRYEQLRSAPALAEAERFPERPLIEDMLAFNRAYRKHLALGMPVNSRHADEIRQAIHEVDQCYQVWSLLRDARCKFYYVTVRRQSLQQVSDLIGAEAFCRGQLPPHVPIWQLPRAN
jgi:hypothetical protein